MTSYGAGADGTTPLQLQQEVVNNVDLPVLIPAMNTERLLTPQQNSHLENRLYPPQERCRELTAYICGKGDDGLMRFYRCLRTTAATHVGHGRLADSMLQHWPWLSQYEPPPQPPPPVLQPASTSQHPMQSSSTTSQHPMQSSSTTSQHSTQTSTSSQHLPQSSATPILPAQIHREYDQLIDIICRCLTERGVTVATLSSAVQYSLHPLLNSLTTNFPQFSNIPSIFQYLKEQQLCHALDVDLLVHILHDSLQQRDLYDEVLAYCSRIDNIEINCSECRFMQATITSTEFLYMMTHHPSLSIAVRDVRRMKEFLANNLSLPRHLFWFCGSHIGSVITVWQFSSNHCKALQLFLDNVSVLQSLNPRVSSVCLQNDQGIIASVDMCPCEEPVSPLVTPPQRTTLDRSPDAMDSEISSTTPSSSSDTTSSHGGK